MDSYYSIFNSWVQRAFEMRLTLINIQQATTLKIPTELRNFPHSVRRVTLNRSTAPAYSEYSSV
jgi:hypothetical protein